MIAKRLIAQLEKLSPQMFAESWDNSGLLVGRSNKTIKRALVCVDATDEVIDQAVSEKIDMIISHHPLIFKGIKNVTDDDFIGRRIYKLCRHDICLYAMHTNFDVMGMADEAADILDLSNRSVLMPTFEDNICKEGIGRVGMLSNQMTLKELAEYVKEQFHIDKVRVYGDLESNVDIVAISPGSGKGMSSYAIKAGADVLITGDIDHHDGIDAVAKGLAVIDASHYGLEKIFVDYITDYIINEIGGVVALPAKQKEPFITV